MFVNHHVAAGISLASLVSASPITKHRGTKKPTSYPNAQAYWPGWEGISRMIVFGDSYTSPTTSTIILTLC